MVKKIVYQLIDYSGFDFWFIQVLWYIIRDSFSSSFREGKIITALILYISIFRPTNLLYVGRKDESFVKQANQEDPDDEKRNRGDNFKLFSRSDIREHYPDLNIPEDYVGLLDADSKTLFADDIIKHLMVFVSFYL